MALIKNEIPILEYDTDENAVIDTKAEGLTPFPEKAVFAFLKDEVERYALSSGGELLDIFKTTTKDFPIYACEYGGKRICLCQAPLGGAAAVQMLDYLIGHGCREIISAGACGALTDIPENEFLVPVRALRDEGASYHYLPPSREIALNKRGIRAVEQALRQAGRKFEQVKTWTTDGFFRETEEMVRYRRQEGCRVVEMECASLAACAEFRNVVLGMLLYTADTLADEKNYQERGWGRASLTEALQLALDAVLLVE